MSHVPVMLDEAVDALALQQGKRIVDGTFGAGGYSKAILRHDGVCVLALDRDRAVKPQAEDVKAEFGARFDFALTPFSNLETAAHAHGWDHVEGVVLDLGVSSMQIDQPQRGFSFMHDGPLDMRMSASGPSAADAVNALDAAELGAIFRTFGEEKHARRAAAAIVEERAREPITTTAALATLLARVLGKGWQKIHPATRIFQALRIYINDELGELARALAAAERLLAPAGRLVVVAFHSLEDRMVKQFLRQRAEAPAPPSRHLPDAAAQPFLPGFTLPVRKAIRPTAEEIASNPRARSARLRVGIRTTAPVMPATGPVFPGIAALSSLEARL